MLYAKKIRDLCISLPRRPGRPAFVSAASGLVRIQNWLYVVADDELDLGAFNLGSSEAGVLHSLMDGVLPLNHGARKKEKPDLESLVLLPANAAWPGGAMLAIPSGSARNRMVGVWVQLSEIGSAVSSKCLVDFAPLYLQLMKIFPELNIEGAVVSGDSLKLLQRGNGACGENAIIDIDLIQVLDGLCTKSLSPNSVQAIHRHDLGSLNGIRLSFTDATPLENGSILFIAAAEDSGDTYNDGQIAGSVAGIIDRFGKIVFQEEISPCMKAEGVSAILNNGRVELLLVTDGDDPNQAAELFSCVIEEQK